MNIKFLFLSTIFVFCCHFLTAQSTLTLKPNGANGKDAMVHSRLFNRNLGSHPEFTASAWTNIGIPMVGRSLVEFDLSCIPQEANVTSAQLSLYSFFSTSNGSHSTQDGSNAAWLRRVIEAWEEDAVTWATQPATTEVNQVELPASTNDIQDYLNIDVTALVQDMVNDPSNSHGFQIRLQTEQYYRRLLFGSSDNINEQLHPMLVVVYDSIPNLITSTIAGPDDTLTCIVLQTSLTAGGLTGLDHLAIDWDGPGIITDPSSATIDVNMPGDYYLTVIDTTNGCAGMDTVVVEQLIDTPNAEAGANDSIFCADQLVIFSAEGSDTGPEISYAWNGPGGNGSEFEFETGTPGLYILSVTNPTTGCVGIDSVLLEAGEFLNAAPLVIPPACFGDESGVIDLSDVFGGQGPYMYGVAGFDFQDTPLFENIAAGTYVVYVQDMNGCQWQSSVNVAQGPSFDVQVGQDLYLELGDTIQLESTIFPGFDQIDSIVWNPSEYLSCRTCPNPVLTAIINQTITAMIYAGIACEDSASLRLAVDKPVEVYVPNVFSPNGDGVNDVVTVYASNNVEEIIEFEIFGRWGEKVFHNSNFEPDLESHGWDGTFKGEMLGPVVFTYRVRARLIDGRELDFSGDITLAR